MPKRLVIDLDGTLTYLNTGSGYHNVHVNEEVAQKLRDYKRDGFEIVIYTSRNMRTYDNSVGKINAHTLPVAIDWLNKNNIPFDEIHVGKPWCGHEGFYVDDKAIRPDEFATLSYEEICRIIK